MMNFVRQRYLHTYFGIETVNKSQHSLIQFIIFKRCSLEHNKLEFSELNIPSIEPYAPKEPWNIKGNRPLYHDLETSNQKIYGLEKLKIVQLE